MKSNEAAPCRSCGAALVPDMPFCPSCGAPVGADAMSRCAACGGLLTPDKAFCHWCGASVAPEPAAALCAACGGPLKPGKAFCHLCGAPVAPAVQAPRCRSCGGELVPGRPFCHLCGTPLAAMATAPGAASAPAISPGTPSMPPDAAQSGAASAVADTASVLASPARTRTGAAGISPSTALFIPETAPPGAGDEAAAPRAEGEAAAPRAEGGAAAPLTAAVTPMGRPDGPPAEAMTAPTPAAPAPAVCGACGGELLAEMPFCPTCGTRVDVDAAPPPAPLPSDLCRSCGGELLAHMPFCPHCGTLVSAAAAPTCANCDGPLDPDLPFCPTCGIRVRQRGDAGHVAPSVPPAPTPPDSWAALPGVAAGAAVIATPPGAVAAMPPDAAVAGLPPDAAVIAGPPDAAPAGGAASLAVATMPRQVARRRWRRRTVVPIVIAAALVLGLGGAAAAFVLPWVWPSGFHTAEFMPPDTFSYTTITVRPGLFQLLGAASVVNDFTSQPGFAAAVRADQNAITTGAGGGGGTSGVDLRRDIWPLLNGELSEAVYGNLLHPDVVVMAHSSDAAKLLRLLARLLNAPAPGGSYRGALLDSGMGHIGSLGIAGAAAGNWVVLAGSDGYGEDTGQAAVQRVIDHILDGSSNSLAATSRYSQVVNRLPGGKLGFEYEDTQPLLTPFITLSGLVIPPEAQPFVNALSQRAALSLSAGNNALTLHWESIADEPPPPPSQSVPGDARAVLRAMPSDTLIAIADNDAPALLSHVDDALTAYLNRTGTNLNLQFTGWLGGETGVGLGPGTLAPDTTGFGVTTGTPDLYVLAKVGDTTAAEETLLLLDPFIHPQSAYYSGVLMHQIPSVPNSDAAYGLVGQEFYAIYGRVGHVLDARGGPGLEANPRFKSVEDSIDSHGFTFFVDVQGLRALLERLMPAASQAAYDQQARPFLLPLRALGGGLRADTGGALHGMLTLSLSR